jgi:hypothetical protein
MQTATAYWPIIADATLKFYLGPGGDSLVFSGTRNDTTDYDTTLTVPKGHFGRAVVTINYTGTSGLEETWSYDLTDTAGTFLFPPVAGHTCRVWLLVKKPNGTPASGVTIAAMLARSEVRDSAGVAVVNSIIRETTGPDGKASFDLLYSDYMVPQTRWIFVGQSPSVALLRKSVLVPSQDQWYLDFSDTARVR